MKFNEAQRKAVEHMDGPMLVLAGPGSGKTLVITYRTKMLIEKDIDEGNILVVTFTKAAANEMKSRFLKLMGKSTTRVTFGTFHSVFFNIIKLAYGFTSGNVLLEGKKLDYIRNEIKKYDLDIDEELEKKIAAEISEIKNERIDLDKYYSLSCPFDVFRKIYNSYEEFLRQQQMLDFDDMLVFCYELFDKRKDILAKWQNKYKYILVDEFQDINSIQYNIVKMLAEPQNNLFIVGDDDQSIYRFRGARPEILLGFEKEYKGTAKIVLDINYRSTQNILDAAQTLISNNKVRYNKKILTENTIGDSVQVVHIANQRDENNYIIANIIRDIEEKELSYDEMAVIYRVNGQARQLVERLMEYNIPFKIRDQLPNIYEHWIAKDIIAYIKMARGELTRANFFRVMNRPLRYLSRTNITKEIIDFAELKKLELQRPWIYERIEDFEYDLKILNRLKPKAMIGYIRLTIGYEEYLKKYGDERKISFQELQDILNEISEGIEQYDNIEDWFAYIENYAELLKEKSVEINSEKNAVTLSTMHSSKGLEYNTVYIMDVNEKIIPHEKSTMEYDLEEERRLFYVAMTRAKEKLIMIYINERYNKKLEKSRFLKEIEKLKIKK